MAALAWAFAPRPVEVEVAAVQQGRFEQAIEEDGRTRLKDRYTVSAPVAARLARITLREGDRVAAGDIVAMLTPVMSPMVDERSRARRTARLKAAAAGVERAAARIARARIALQEATAGTGAHRKAGRRRLRRRRPGSTRSAWRWQAPSASSTWRSAEREVAVHEQAQAAAALQPRRRRRARPAAERCARPVAGVVLRVAQTERGHASPPARRCSTSATRAGWKW